MILIAFKVFHTHTYSHTHKTPPPWDCSIALGLSLSSVQLATVIRKAWTYICSVLLRAGSPITAFIVF